MPPWATSGGHWPLLAFLPSSNRWAWTRVTTGGQAVWLCSHLSMGIPLWLALFVTTISWCMPCLHLMHKLYREGQEKKVYRTIRWLQLRATRFRSRWGIRRKCCGVCYRGRSSGGSTYWRLPRAAFLRWRLSLAIVWDNATCTLTASQTL